MWNASQLTRFFEAHRQHAAPLVLVTVYETRGSTYSKPGSRMLIDGEGLFQGMLSGGCLEGDLAIRAAVVIDSGEPQLVTYDLGRDDELWGMGVGCDGVMRVFLQAVDSVDGYEPLATIVSVMNGDAPAVAYTVIESTSASAPAGATVVVGAAETRAFGLDPGAASRVVAAGPPAASGTREVGLGDGQATVLAALIEPAPRLLVLGAGLDAEPLLRFATELGWRCTVVDHREAYLEAGDFAGAERTLACPAAQLAEHVDLALFDRCIVMSHHLDSDRQYLRQLAGTGMRYIGLLGPPHRRERLIADLGEEAGDLARRVHGPAGIDFGGRGPAVIALSIVAEMQQLLGSRDG